MKDVTIGELSKITGIPIRTIRYYEQLNLLLPADRSDGNYRLYSLEQVQTTKIIHLLKKAGMPLNGIKKFLEVQMKTGGQVRGEQVTDMLELELSEAEAKIQELLRLKKKLEQALTISRECKVCKRKCDNCMQSKYTQSSYPELLIYQFKEANKD